MNRYKVTLSSNTVYKEIELASGLKQLKVGTDVDCDVRLRKELFFGQIELVFVKTGDDWTITCSDNMYLTVGDIRKLMTKKLVHGDVLEIRYQESDNLIFTIEFLIDFDDGKKKYERIIDVSGVNSLTIGALPNCSIVLAGEYVKNDMLALSKSADGFTVDIKNTTYGVYINGRKAKSGDEIKDMDFLFVSDFFFYFKGNRLWTEIRRNMSINGLSYIDYPRENRYPEFTRNSRIKIVPNSNEIEILDPPEAPDKPKNGIFMRLLPSMGMLVSAAIMAMLGSITMIIFSGISVAMSVVTAVLTIKSGNKEYKKEIENRKKKYSDYIERKKQEIEEYREEECFALNEIYISQKEERNRLKNFSSDLFDRVRTDDDFLCVRLGTGAVPSKRLIKYKHHERMETADNLQVLPEQISKEYKFVDNAPIICDFKKSNIIGIVGNEENRYLILKNMIFDICLRHYYKDVKLVLIASSQHAYRIESMRFLPNLDNKSMGTRNIACDDESKNLVFEYLYKELSWREQYKTYQTNIVVFFYDEYEFKRHPLSKFVNNSKELGVSFVFFAEQKKDIPLGCDFIVNVTDNKGSLVLTENRDMHSEFTYNTISDDEFKKFVKALAPIYTEEISLEGTLTKNISLFELLNIIAVDDINLENRWNSSKVFKSLSAPIGVSKVGVVNLDLHDKAHGPHGLVAGTTGSGKSEILQTYILSIATLFHPYEVGFVIIDFKGGGMVNQFKNLPHLLGAITNIDGKQINRSLMSIKAELEKRQRLFAEVEVNHIDKYIQKFKSGDAVIPLPHLVLIVDEFAELKAEQPEFMKELISAARIGRSLGVHLILATQKPSGQVNEQIWSNSRFKLCLKVQSQEDSNEVLKSPLAAEIKEPGRAYLQVGNNEIFELFQSAYSGSPESMDDTGSNAKEFTVFDVNLSGKKTPVYIQKRKKEMENCRTQLEAIVDYVCDYCRQNAISKLPDICLPPLPDVLKYYKSSEKISMHGVYARLGVYDNPSNQYQGEVSVNLSEDNLMIIGSAQYGKTNVLQTVIRDLAEKYSSEQVNIYILDFGSMILKNLEKLKHIGAVIVSSEEERVTNLFKMLVRELMYRRERLATEGVSSFASYIEAGFNDLSQIVLMIDNLTALQQLYTGESDTLLNICREGNTVGISVIIANSQTNGIGFRYLSNFSQRIALFCNDSSEYTSLFDRTRISPDNKPGHMLIEVNHQIMEGIVFLAFEGEREIDRVTTMREYVVDINKRNGGAKAKPVPVVPEIVTITSLKTQQQDILKTPYHIPYGINYADMNIEYLNLLQNGILGIIGREESGKTNFVLNVLNLIQSNIFENLTKAYVVDDSRHKLEVVNEYGCVEMYTTDISNAKKAVEEIHSVLLERKNNIIENGANITEALSTEPLLLFVVAGQENIEEILQDGKTQEQVMSIIRDLRKYKAFVIFAGIENTTISYSAPSLLKYIKESKNIIVLEDIGNIRFVEIPLKYQKEFSKEIGIGDGYSLLGGKINKVKTILNK